jgi:hypothetical protein
MNPATLTPDPSAFGIIALMDGEPDRLREAVDLAIERTEGVMSALPGLRMVTVHFNAARTRVAEYIQWASEADFLAFINDDDLSWHVRRIGELSSTQAYASYQTHAVCATPPADRVTISTADSYCTRMGVLACEPEKQRWVADYLKFETERVTRELPGFVSATYFMSHDGTKVGEYLQWETCADYEATAADPAYREHVSVIDHYVTPDVGGYELVWTYAAQS